MLNIKKYQFWKGKHYKTRCFAFIESCWVFFYLKLQKWEKKQAGTSSCECIHGNHTAINHGIWLIEGAASGDMRHDGGWLTHTGRHFQNVNLLERKLCIFSDIISYQNTCIDWHTDHISKKTWKRLYHKRLQPVANVADETDCKVPWEKSRFHHLPSMAFAYISNGDVRYSEEAVWQINDWMKHNPYLYGINWTCAMEVAIRVCNWMWAWWVFKETPAWTDAFNREFLKCLRQHGIYIEKNLEDKGGIRTNHYLSNIVGLLFIGIMFPRFQESGRWKEFGINELVRCMAEMVYPDGVSFENSTSYHRLVLELFSYSALLCRKNDIELPTFFWSRLEKMFEFVFHCILPDGRMPMIGDNDDGCLFVFQNYYGWGRCDYRYLLAIGGELFDRYDMRKAAANQYKGLGKY